MKKSIKILFSVILIIGILLVNVNVFAATDVCKITLSPNKTNLNIGDEVEIEIKLSDITVENGIAGILGKFEYDQDIFEIKYITDSSIVGELGLDALKEEFEIDDLNIISYEDESWYLAYSDVEGADGGVFVGETMGDPVKSSNIIGKIKLKVKNTATTTATEVKLNTVSLIGSDSEEEPYEISTGSTANLKINAVKTEGTQAKQNTNNTQNANNDNAYNMATNTSAPYAGTEDVVPIIFVIAIIAIVALIKVWKYKDI